MNDQVKDATPVVYTDIITNPQTANLPATQESENSLMNLIAEMARGGKIDIVEKLIGMKNSQDDREAKLAFARDYAPMKAELPMIIKNKINSHTKSGYADLANINEVVDPILGKYGFATSTKIISQDSTTVTACAELIHRAGHRESMELTMPLDTTGGNAKSGPQSIVSTISYLKRAAKCALLDIAAGDDNDGNAPESDARAGFITIEQAAEIDKRLRDLGGDRKVFLQCLGADKVEEIPAVNHKKAIANLNGKEQRLKEEKAKAKLPEAPGAA